MSNTINAFGQEAPSRPALRVIQGGGGSRDYRGRVRCKDCRHFDKSGCTKGIKIRSWCHWRQCSEHSSYQRGSK